jgi:hypothetical protein
MQAVNSECNGLLQQADWYYTLFRESDAETLTANLIQFLCPAASHVARQV